MPRPVCVRCQVEMTMVKAVTVQFNAFATGGAYEQYQGDLAECPICKAQVVARFGQHPSWRHFDDGHPQPDVISRERNGQGLLAPAEQLRPPKED